MVFKVLASGIGKTGVPAVPSVFGPPWSPDQSVGTSRALSAGCLMYCSKTPAHIGHLCSLPHHWASSHAICPQQDCFNANYPLFRVLLVLPQNLQTYF